MKKILYFLFVVALLSLTSCWGIDNWDAPDCRFYGKLTDSYTGENLMTSQNEFKIRVWERSFTENVPQQQDLAVMQDGTYNHTKMFAGTYDMIPYDGPFWPVADTTKNVVLTKETEQNFTVTPYLQLIEFNQRLQARSDGYNLYLSCKLKAPRRQGLPNLREIKPFLSLSPFCGQSGTSGSGFTPNSFIDISEYNDRRIQLNRSWGDEMARTGIDKDSEISGTYEIGPLPVKFGYTYNVRIGAGCNVGGNKYNYTPIVKIVVPNQ